MSNNTPIMNADALQAELRELLIPHKDKILEVIGEYFSVAKLAANMNITFLQDAVNNDYVGEGVDDMNNSVKQLELLYRDFSKHDSAKAQAHLGIFVEIFGGVELIMNRYRAGNPEVKDVTREKVGELDDAIAYKHECFLGIMTLLEGKKIPQEIKDGVADWLKQNGHEGRQ